MKTNKFIIILLALVTSISFTSCVEDGDFTVPESLGAEENAKLKAFLATNPEVKTVQQVKDLFVNGQATQITQNFVVKGYVSSSDKSGNFFKEFYLQDKAENPTAAIKIALELTDSYNKFNLGREVNIKLQNLYLGETRSGDGVITIGGDFDVNDVDNLSLNQVESNLLRSETTKKLVPLKLTLSQIGANNIGMYVQIDNAQFPTAIAGKTTFHDKNERFDTKRDIESCEAFGFVNFPLETSAFADFKFSTLPKNGGTIKAVVTKTFDGRQTVLALNDVNDVEMDGARCVPQDKSTFTESFSDEFNSLSNWNSFSIIGNESWKLSSANRGNPGTAAEMSGFNRGAKNNEDWLVSNVYDLSGFTSAFFIFDSLKRFEGNDLEAFYSTDYTGGDPTANGTWIKVGASLDKNVNSWTSWNTSTGSNITPVVGSNVFIAFKYTSNSSTAATFRVDNFKILTK